MKKAIVLLLLVASVQIYAQVNLTSSLVACYALDGSAAEPINTLTGTLSAVTPTVNRFNTPGSALEFNGTAASHVKLPNSPLLKANAVSFSCWVKLNKISAPQMMVYVHNGCVSFYEGYQLAFNNPGGVPRFEIAKSQANCTAGGQAILASGPGNVQANTWYHLGFYIGPDSLKLYVNGALSSSAAKPQALAYNASTEVILGGTNNSPNCPLDGTLDNVRFYNRKLNNAEMLALFQQDPSCTAAAGLPPQASFSVSSLNICAGGTMALTDLSANVPTSWNWQMPGALTPTASVANPIISFPGPGNYVISLVSMNPSGASNTATQSVFVTPNPTIGIISGNTLVCAGQSATLMATGASGYTWSTGQQGPQLVITPSQATSYTVTGKDNLGCTGTAVQSVSIAPNLTLNVQSSHNLLCAGQPATLTATGAPDYTWTGGQQGSTLVINPSQTTSYTVTGSNSAGCTGTIALTQVVIAQPQVSAISSKSVICKGMESSVLTGLGAVTYTWNTNQASPSISVSPAVQTTYTVTGTDNNGCKNTATVTIRAQDCNLTGIEKDEGDVFDPVIYPNPAKDRFEIGGTYGILFSVTITNVLGKEVVSIPGSDEDYFIGELPRGIYFVRIDSGKESRVIKLLKE